MANLATERTPKQRQDTAERLLPVLIDAWHELPEIASEIDAWDQGEASTYVEEWAHSESLRREIERSAEDGVLTESQFQQLVELRELVAERKPILNRLLGVSEAAAR